VWIYTGNKLAKIHGNILSLNENIAKSFRRGATFLSHTLYALDMLLIKAVYLLT